MPNYDDFYNAIGKAINPEDVFEETPADLKTFLYDKQFMHLPPLSEVQEDLIERGSQIYKKETLVYLYGEKEAERIWAKNTRELHLMLGKASGKSVISQVIFAYIVHKLLCLENPATYYDRPDGQNIDLVNMANDARMALNSIFNSFVERIKRAPWFNGKWHARNNDIAFDKRITLHSLHSQHSSAESLEILAVILEEIDAFTPEYAQEMHKALSGTVTSRFPDLGVVIALSFPRKKNGWMMQRYFDVAAPGGMEIEEETFTFKLNEELEDDSEGNEFQVTWEKSRITAYKYSNIYAVRACTWDVNPTKHPQQFVMAFYEDEVDALLRFAANPPETDDNSFFKNHQKLEDAFDQPNGFDGDIRIRAEEDKTYYLHIDLSSVHDRTVVAMGHVDHWEEVDMGTLKTDPAPFIIIDLFRIWEPTKGNPVNHQEVMQFILELCKKFKVDLVTFDQWGSFNMIEYLVEVGIRAEKKSLARPEYQEFALAVGDGRIKGPQDDRFMDELKNLVILPNGKVDHPKKNHNDITEAVTGVIRNCVENEIQDSSVNVVSLSTIRRQEDLTAEAKAAKVKSTMPNDLADWIKALGEINSQ